MNAINMSIATAIIAAACFISLAASKNVEVCQWETFEARCASDEVILVKEARYGRMRVGRCLPRNYFVGCSSDVTSYMHGRCSGRQHCRVPVPDPVMFASQPCPKDLVAHLEADYECVKVAKWDHQSCNSVLTATSGLIAKPADTVQDIRKKHHCPRRIVAQPGQTINVYLSDFYNKYQKDSSATESPFHGCLPYGHVTEDGTAAPAGICGGEMKKDQLVYRSKSNVVDITLTAPSSHSHHFLIKYEVVGCPSLQAPRNGWINYQKDRAIVHCNNSHTASELKCENNQWMGQFPECASHASPIQMAISSMSFTSRSEGLLIAVIIGVAFGVLVGVSLLLFATRRSKKSNKSEQLPTDDEINKSNLLNQTTVDSKDCSSYFKGLDAYQYHPIIDPSYVPICTEDGKLTFVPSKPVHHIVENIYEIPMSGNIGVKVSGFKSSSWQNGIPPV